MVAEEIEKIFNIETKTSENYKIALTHPSYVKDNNLPYSESYERLEFLGDAVLKLAISNILFKEYPNYNEGQMSKIRSIIVSDNVLSQIAVKIGLDKLIIAGIHDKKQGICKLESVTACAFEAILGAYFLDGQFYKVMDFLELNLKKYIVEVDKNFVKYNAKAILQEYTQGLTKETPFYRLVEEKGAEHNKTFIVEVLYRGDVIAQGSGKSKKDAEQHAAYKACIKLGAVHE